MSKGKIGQLMISATERALHRATPQAASSLAHSALAASSRSFSTHTLAPVATHQPHSQNFTSLATPAARFSTPQNKRPFSSSSKPEAAESDLMSKLGAVLGSIFFIGGSAVVIDLMTRERDIIVDTMEPTKTIRNAADFTEENKETPGGYLSKGWYKDAENKEYIIKGARSKWQIGREVLVSKLYTRIYSELGVDYPRCIVVQEPTEIEGKVKIKTGSEVFPGAMDLAQFAQAYYDAKQLTSTPESAPSKAYADAAKFVAQVERPEAVMGMGVALALDLAMGKHQDIKLPNIIIYPKGDKFQIVPIDHEFACESAHSLYDTKDMAADKMPQLASTLMKYVNDYTKPQMIDNHLKREVLVAIRPIFVQSIQNDLEQGNIAKAYVATAQIPQNQILRIEETTNGIYNSREHRLFQERMLAKQVKVVIHSDDEQKRSHTARLQQESTGRSR